MYFLTNTNQSLKCATSEGVALPYSALDFTTVYVVNTAHISVERGSKCYTGYIDDTFRELLPTPAESHTEHSVKSIHISNTDTITHTLTFIIIDDGNIRPIYKCQLKPGWTVAYINEGGWSVYDEFGIKKKDNTDFFLEISKGNISGTIDYSAFGINPSVNIATLPEDIFSQGGVFIPPTTYRIHNISSTSANDTAAGTGARTIEVFGVVSTGLASEIIIMNGLANVATVNAYSDIYRMHVLTAGSGNTNAGIITSTAQVDATITCTLPVDGLNNCRKAIRLIPPGYTGYLFNFQGGMYCATAGSYADCYLLQGSNYNILKPIAYHSLSNTGSSSEMDIFTTPYKLNSGEWVKATTTTVSNNNTLIQAKFDLVLIKD